MDEGRQAKTSCNNEYLRFCRVEIKLRPAPLLHVPLENDEREGRGRARGGEG